MNNTDLHKWTQQACFFSTAAYRHTYKLNRQQLTRVKLTTDGQQAMPSYGKNLITTIRSSTIINVIKRLNPMFGQRGPRWPPPIFQPLRPD